MTDRVSILSALFALVLAACGGGGGGAEDEGSGQGAGPSGSLQGGSESMNGGSGSNQSDAEILEEIIGNAPEPFEREFEGIVEQPAPWGGLEVRVTGARLFRGEVPDEIAMTSLFTARIVYAVVDVRVRQLATEGQTDYRERDTWDLLLADNTRAAPVNALGLLLAPGDDSPASLWYEVEEDTDLSGAVLQVHGDPRGSLEPLDIPLDAATTFESEAVVDGLVGQSAQPSSADGELSFEVLEAAYGVNISSISRRAPAGMRLLHTVMRVGYSGVLSESFSSRDAGPRIVIGGIDYPPARGEIVTIGTGSTVDIPMTYEIEEGVTEFELVFDTGDPEPTTIPVSVPASIAEAG